MKLIQTVTIADGWLQGCQHLLNCPGWLDTTVVLHVDEPMRIRRQDRLVADALDAFLVAHDKFSNHTVAETIFPGYEYMRRGVYNVYPNEIYPKIKQHPDMRQWGAYAYRLLRRENHDGTEYNPLAAC